MSRRRVLLTNRHNAQYMMDLFGKWFVQDLPEASAIVHFEDVALRWQDGPIETISKSINNNCYAHLPVHLDWKPSAGAFERLRGVLCATYSGQPDAREIDENMEVIALDDCALPREMIVLLSEGELEFGEFQTTGQRVRRELLQAHGIE